jgi:hypothetical protein
MPWELLLWCCRFFEEAVIGDSRLDHSPLLSRQLFQFAARSRSVLSSEPNRDEGTGANDFFRGAFEMGLQTVGKKLSLHETASDSQAIALAP